MDVIIDPKIKKILKIFAFAFFCFLIFLFLLKVFYFNRPKLSPYEVAKNYLFYEQNQIRKKAEKLLFPRFEKVKILDKNYKDLRKEISPSKKSVFPEFELEKEEISGRKAEVFLKEKLKNEAYFFGYLLQGEVEFEVSLIKTGSFKRGYQWKIIKISSKDLVEKRKIGDEVEIEKGLFLKILEIKEKKIKKYPQTKFILLKVKLKNKTSRKKSFNFYSYFSLKKGEEILVPPCETSALFLPKPILKGKILPQSEFVGYTLFEIGEDFGDFDEIIFQSPRKKVIFSR